jgi:multidrug efflux pump subunit AcrA (membrane-fusion protein)
MKLAIALLAIALVGGGGWWLWNGRDGAGSPAAEISESGLFTVRKGDLPISLTENGTLVAKESQKIVPMFRSRGKITFIVEEGKVVAEGEELCKFDTTELQQQIDQAQLEITKAEADLQTAKTELEIQGKENESNIKKANIALEKATKDKEKYEEGDEPQEKRKLEIAIREADKAFEKAKQNYEDSKRLFEKKFINKSTLEQDEQEFERAQIAKERAYKDKELFEKYTLPMTRRDKQTALEDAQLGLETASKRAESTLRQKEVAVEQQQKRLDKLNQQLKERQEELAKMVLKAPCPGIVIYGDPRYMWSDLDTNMKVGGEVWGGNTLFTIPDLRVMQVKLQVHEADINKIKLEMPARVTMDTYPGLLLQGKVTKIAAIAAGASNPWEANQEVKKFDVEITLESTTQVELKPGISAKAEVLIDTRKEAVYVPLQCVFLEGGKHWCYALDASRQPQKTEVKPGLSNDTYVELLEGLDAGKLVLLYNPSVPTGAAPQEESGEPKPGEPKPGEPPAAAPAGAPTNAGAPPAPPTGGA